MPGCGYPLTAVDIYAPAWTCLCHSLQQTVIKIILYFQVGNLLSPWCRHSYSGDIRGGGQISGDVSKRYCYPMHAALTQDRTPCIPTMAILLVTLIPYLFKVA